MRVVPPRFDHEAVFLNEFARTVVEHGIETDVTLQWGVHTPSDGPTIYVECGWLPRWWYQVSHRGINAQHHLAPLKCRGLDAEQSWKVDTHLRRIREGKDAPPWGYLDIAAPPIECVP